MSAWSLEWKCRTYNGKIAVYLFCLFIFIRKNRYTANFSPKIHLQAMVQDEVLAHRLGLIPLNINPDKFEFKPGTVSMAQSPIAF